MLFFVFLFYLQTDFSVRILAVSFVSICLFFLNLGRGLGRGFGCDSLPNNQEAHKLYINTTQSKSNKSAGGGRICKTLQIDADGNVKLLLAFIYFTLDPLPHCLLGLFLYLDQTSSSPLFYVVSAPAAYRP